MEAGGVQYGMQTFDQSIMKLHKKGLISFDEAMRHATNPDDFDLRLRGISGSADRWKDEAAEESGTGDHRLDARNDFTKY
jgi:twitching motility protein PilT